MCYFCCDCGGRWRGLLAQRLSIYADVVTAEAIDVAAPGDNCLLCLRRPPGCLLACRHSVSFVFLLHF